MQQKNRFITFIWFIFQIIVSATLVVWHLTIRRETETFTNTTNAVFITIHDTFRCE